MFIRLLLLLAVILAPALTVFAEIPIFPQPREILSSYRSYVDVEAPVENTSGVYEVQLPQRFLELQNVTVYDIINQSIEPHAVRQAAYDREGSYQVATQPVNFRASNLVDGNHDSYADFELPWASHGDVEITLRRDRAATSSSLLIGLGSEIALPISVTVLAFVDGDFLQVTKINNLREREIHFSPTVSNAWKIRMRFSQPLRITELFLRDERDMSENSVVRFEGKSGRLYRVYFDSEKVVFRMNPPEDLMLKQQVQKLAVSDEILNPLFIRQDVDSDGIADIHDNCVFVPNEDQGDMNENRRGDLCDDGDSDGIIAVADNCVNKPNRDQKDNDRDGVGDVCDLSDDNYMVKFPWLPTVGISGVVMSLVVLLGFIVHAMLEQRKVTYTSRPKG